ncbi:unnamed protein product [Peronospora belbahrii]|uniref:glucan 1,3-beta-glucosidase n=2 Tax=Peronospora belbahrii TaxID=622444 RepID=A0ABN8CM53_9STRA|nr:unnamed protein product [Peronospora belbahrii]
MKLAYATAILVSFPTTLAITMDGNYTVFTHVQTQIRNGAIPCRGVNLGGWLVFEHWMTSNAAVSKSIDSRYLDSGEFISITKSENPDKVRSMLSKHHDTFITEDDIKQIAAAGVNTLRVPVGFWIIGYDNYDPTNQREIEAYSPGTIMYLDRLIRVWAMKYNVAVLVDVHAAKGSQNGNDHSSPSTPGQILWSEKRENIANTIEVVRFLAARYINDEAFLGIGLLNEPRGNVSASLLYQYYLDAYQVVRSTGSDCVLTIMSMLDSKNPMELAGFMPMPRYKNVWVEWHSYFIWTYENRTNKHLVEVDVKQDYQEKMTKWNAMTDNNPLFIGEWSFASPSNMLLNDPELFYEFAKAQLEIHSQAAKGWTYWTWKLDVKGNKLDSWSLQRLLTDDRIAKLLRNTL